MMMKTFAALATVAVASAQESTWSDCTVPIAPTSNRQITFDPPVPVSGENLIQLTGDVNIPVSGGSCPTTMTWNGVPILNDSFSVCGNSTIGLPINLGTLYVQALDCPTTEGPVVIDIIADISPLAPPGNYVVEADCSTSDNTPLACAEVFMRL